VPRARSWSATGGEEPQRIYCDVLTTGRELGVQMPTLCNVLALDGPGQGGALIQQDLVLRPDWENVVRSVVDYAVTRSEIDPGRLALLGPSLGAHLAPRAASEEHRLAACIADCGAFDLHAAFLRRLPAPLARGVARGNRAATATLRRLFRYLINKPTAGWALRRGLLVHGVDDPFELIDALKAFTLEGRAARITCPTWVCSAEGDEISESAPNSSQRSPVSGSTSTSPPPKAPAITAKPAPARSTTHARSPGSTRCSAPLLPAARTAQ
jgi:pimeloyl-ACP methyl ester carboxylesterase